jgi:DnaJ-class molecular chaperone
VYDKYGKEGLTQGGGGGGQSFGGTRGGHQFDFQRADDIFKNFFGGRDPFASFFDDDDDFPSMFGHGGKSKSKKNKGARDPFE